MSGQPKIKQLYEHYRDHLAHDVPFFEAAMRLLGLDVQFSASRLAEIPRTGPLVIVANHPFGVLDGLVICWLTSLRRMDFKVLTNSALDGVPEARPYILPVDFSGTKEALAANVAMRKEALDHVKAGGCFSLELRLALVFREVKRRMGTALPVVIGETLTPDALKDAGKRKGLMEFLRAQTYGLAPIGQTLRYDAATRRFMAKKPLVFR